VRQPLPARPSSLQVSRLIHVRSHHRCRAPDQASPRFHRHPDDSP
jgi:hypothetical protein